MRPVTNDSYAQQEYSPMLSSSQCPPGCTCGYSTYMMNGSSPNQPYQYPTPEYQNMDYYDSYSSPPAATVVGEVPSSPVSVVDSFPSEYSKQLQQQQQQQQPPAQESGKYPFELIMQVIARGLIGSATELNLDPKAFRTKLDCANSQKLSSLVFFKSFTQKDVNLQCALILQVIMYWSLEETIPSHVLEDAYEPPRRSRSSRRDSAHGGSSKRRNRLPPPPRYWTRLENAAVIGMMLGLPFELLKLTLQETSQELRLGDVDAILDTNSIEALELFQSGSLAARYNNRGRNRHNGSASPITPPAEDYGDIKMGYNNR